METFTPTSLSSEILVQHKHDGTILTPDKDDLSYMHWNIRSLTNKLHIVELYIASFPGVLHIIVISETWLTPENSFTYQIDGYYAIHNVRQSADGGGISIFVHRSLCSVTPQIVTDLVTADLHHFLVVRIPSINTTVAVPYNRPGGSTSSFLTDLETICLNQTNCQLMGDSNFDEKSLVK